MTISPKTPQPASSLPTDRVDWNSRGWLVGCMVVVGCGLVLVGSGTSLPTLIANIAKGAFGTAFGLRETLTRATPILLCALAVAVPARAGLFNLGAEGQFHAGAIAATFGVLAMPIDDRSYLFVPLVLLLAVIGGALLALVPAALRAVFGVSEVLSSLMLNFVAIDAMLWLVHGPWRDPGALGWPYATAFPSGAIMPRLAGTNVHAGLLLGILAAAGLFWLFRYSILGAATRYLESNVVAAQQLRLPVARYFLIVFALGGALAAIAGYGEVSVIQGRLRPSLSVGYGYIGFLVSWLGGHRFLWLLPLSLFAGGLYSGVDALQLTSGLPSATAQIMIGSSFLFFLAIGNRFRAGSASNQLGHE